MNYEDEQDQYLAPYALLHKYSGGRNYPEKGDDYRTSFQRDRDRVIHSKAFRRLGYKTQVFINSEGDNYRTRLTHSIEVGQIARTVASALRLNRDFAESVALAHDLGHTPFGHAGEYALNRLMESHGGFEHNCQSLRIVSLLETRYMDFRGINLTKAALKGMMKHGCSQCNIPVLEELCDERAKEGPSLEAGIVDACDRIAYLHHDLEDGLDSGYLKMEDLFELDIWADAYNKTEEELGSSFTGVRKPHRIRFVIRRLINDSVSDLIENTQAGIETLKPETFQDVLDIPSDHFPVNNTPAMKERLKKMQQFLYRELYRNPAVMKMSRRGSRIIETLFEEYVLNPEIMPSHVQERIQQHGLHRTVSDYIAGMTDRYALKEYGYITGLSPDSGN